MWDEISRYFEKYPMQKRVAMLLLRRGFKINNKGKVVAGNIEIPHTQIAKELEIDRRVVDSTTERILKSRKLKEIFSNLEAIAFLKNVAPSLGLGVLVITPIDASIPGFIGEVTSLIARHNIPIRQIIADDPFLTQDPKLTVITDEEIPGGVLAELKKINGVKKITLY